MGLREKMNQNPAIVTGATAAIIVIAVIYIVMSTFRGGTPGAVTKAWYTTDDGATFFADDLDKIPPFKKDGKDAYRVQVFTCDGGKTKFVAYMERYTPDAAKKLADARAKVAAAPKNAPPPPEMDVIEQAESTGLEVKAPKTGDSGWVKPSDKRATAIMELKCPGGGKIDNLEPVIP